MDQLTTAQDRPEQAGRHPTEESLRGQIAALERALQSSRRIGIALGIVMMTRKVDEDAAFVLLTEFSQLTHRKVRDLADEIALTGALPDTP